MRAGQPVAAVEPEGPGLFRAVQTLLKNDSDVKKYLNDSEIEEQFDLGYHFKHVDTIFKVFDEA